MRGGNSIAIASHVFVTGASQDLLEYLNQQKTEHVLFLGHPLYFDTRLKGSGYDLFHKGELVRQKYFDLVKRPKFLEYVLQVGLNIWFVAKTLRRWDLFVGNDNLNAFSGLILRRLGIVKKVVYHTIDYNPQRFESRLENFIYHFFDRLCVKRCDETWNVSPRMEDARVAYYGLRGGHQKVVPMGVWAKRVQPLPLSKIEKHTLVFMGHVTRKQGVEHVLDAIPLVVESLPDFKFVVMGTGDYVGTLKRKVTKLKIEKYVEFTGYINEHTEIEERLCRYAVGIALYDLYIQKDMLSFTYFADPSKIKVYMACGLPVILTDVPYNAVRLEKEGTARIVLQEPQSIADGIIEVMANISKYRNRVLEKRSEYDWEKIFPEALKSVV